MIVYYSITILANIIAIFIFHKNINISALSIIPLILIALMIFQAYFFKKEKVENGFRTTYRSNLTDNEENNMLNSASTFLLATIPWIIPFIFFFPSFVKILSVLVYIVGLIGGLILYRIKNKGKIVDRIDVEEYRRVTISDNPEYNKEIHGTLRNFEKNVMKEYYRKEEEYREKLLRIAPIIEDGKADDYKDFYYNIYKFNKTNG